MTTGVWHDPELLAELRHDGAALLAEEEAVWNSDETGFPKKGSKSVGVKRQYSGTLGRTDNCQIGVFANDCSSKGHTFMDRRLFLPEEWANDPVWRAAAGVPEAVIFRTKPALELRRKTLCHEPEAQARKNLTSCEKVFFAVALCCSAPSGRTR